MISRRHSGPAKRLRTRSYDEGLTDGRVETRDSGRTNANTTMLPLFLPRDLLHIGVEELESSSPASLLSERQTKALQEPNAAELINSPYRALASVGSHAKHATCNIHHHFVPSTSSDDFMQERTHPGHPASRKGVGALPRREH